MQIYYPESTLDHLFNGSDSKKLQTRWLIFNLTPHRSEVTKTCNHCYYKLPFHLSIRVPIFLCGQKNRKRIHSHLHNELQQHLCLLIYKKEMKKRKESYPKHMFLPVRQSIYLIQKFLLPDPEEERERAIRVVFWS